MKFKLNKTVKNSLSIDDIDASNTPSLIAYWKISDYSIGSAVKDYSGNSLDLDLICALGDPWWIGR